MRLLPKQRGAGSNHVACYIYLEEKGVLTKNFRTPFRKREPWHFDLTDFQMEEDRA